MKKLLALGAALILALAVPLAATGKNQDAAVSAGPPAGGPSGDGAAHP